jgi:hypothetical protein
MARPAATERKPQCPGSRTWVAARDTRDDEGRTIICIYCGRRVATPLARQGKGRRIAPHEKESS